MKRALKIKLTILALVFPFSFTFAGYIIAENSYLLGFEFNSSLATLIISLIGLTLGILFNFICYYRKVFAIAIYQFPVPFTLFFSFWWISNSFVNDGLALFIGLLGLLTGLWLNSILVTPYQFYKIKKRVLAFLYLFYSIIILGIFMGVPIFNILLGVFAGNYLAIRIISYVRNGQNIRKSINQGALFSSFVILLVTILAGLMAIVDIDSYVETFTQLTKIPINATKFVWFLVFAGSFGIVLQYVITRFTAYTILQLHNYRKSTVQRA